MPRSGQQVGLKVNPLPDNKMFALSKMKAFAADNFNVAKMAQFSVTR